MCGIFPMGILHVWILHIGIFPVWQTGLRHLIDVELRADHSALIISATVTDKVAVFLKLLECRKYGVGTFLAECRKSTRVENCQPSLKDSIFERRPTALRERFLSLRWVLPMTVKSRVLLTR